MYLKSAFLAFASLLPMCIMAQTEMTTTDLASGVYSSKTFSSRVTCHDPSAIYDDVTTPTSPQLYIYGSHLGRGYTTASSNYATWSTFKAGEESSTATNSLFCNTSGTLVNFSNAYSKHAITKVKNYQGEEVDFGNFDAHGWQYTGSTVAGNEWAPDIIYNKTMKKWCMYMSLNGDKWCSSIVCFTSDNIKGPWKYQGPVVFSGFCNTYTHVSYAASADWKNTDLAIATGATSLPTRYNVGSKWGTYWPNCIDPCVFYDDNDELWMSYGSWSGGIFMLKLNPENGLRDYTYTYDYLISGSTTTSTAANANCTSDPYFGLKIAGGYYVSGEASYIQKIGKYYFLFMSYGGLSAKEGYQMRIFRSENLQGPYKDPYGTDARYTSYQLNYGPTAASNRGVLLFGGYKWDLMPYAEVAQGHNSAFTDNQGRSFVVYHTRTNDGTEGHQVRVHQLFLNSDGWLMAAPYEFAGETVTDETIASTASVDDADIPGDYQFMRHQYNQDYANLAYESPVNITLSADGKISGGATGTWTRTAGTDYINLVISGVTYKGVLVNQTITYTNIKALCIAALSSSSGSLTIGQSTFTRNQEIWLSKAATKQAIKYTYDKNKAKVSFTDGSTINSDLTLPSVDYLGADITWTSSNTNVLTDEGKIKGDGTATMTMTISKDGYYYQKSYTLTVSGSGIASTPVYYPESTTKNTTSAWWTNFSTEDYTLEMGKSIEFKFTNYSNKEANYKNWSLYGASATHGTTGATEYFGIRCDNWDNTTGSSTGCTSNYVWSTFTSDMDGSTVDMTVDYTSAGVFTMTAVITTTAGKTYNYSYTKTLTAKPSTITLYFVSEGSYITQDASGIGDIEIYPMPHTQSNAIYNLSGQKVDASYKGVVIRNGRKYIQK